MLLTELGRAAADPLVFVRSIGVALLHWQGFNSTLKGLRYGEESGEVMLSQLGSMKDRHTWAVTTSDVQDLSVQICHARFNRRHMVSGLRKMSSISALIVLMKSCRFWCWKTEPKQHVEQEQNVDRINE